MDGLLSAEEAIIEDLRDHGVEVSTLEGREWIEPHHEAVPIILKWLRRPTDVRIKAVLLNVLGQEWAKDSAFPVVVGMLDEPAALQADASGRSAERNLVSYICSFPNGKLWPVVLEVARHPVLREEVRSLALERAGRFRKHADDILLLYSEFVGSESPMIAMAISEGLRSLGDPRGVAVLERVRDVDSNVVRSKARTRGRLAPI
jgi:hypothetical protein